MSCTLITTSADYRPPPFKLFNSWLPKDGFDDTVKKAWEDFRGYSNPDAYLAAKIRLLKNAIKSRKKESDEKTNNELFKIKSEVALIEKAAESRPLTDLELETRNLGLR